MYFSKDQFHYVKISLFAESPPERTGRRRSMPGSSSDKTTPAMEATSTAATPFRVTVSTVSVFFCTASVFSICFTLWLSLCIHLSLPEQAVSYISVSTESWSGVQMDPCQSETRLLQILEWDLWCLASAHHASWAYVQHSILHWLFTSGVISHCISRWIMFTCFKQANTHTHTHFHTCAHTQRRHSLTSKHTVSPRLCQTCTHMQQAFVCHLALIQNQYAFCHV